MKRIIPMFVAICALAVSSFARPVSQTKCCCAHAAATCCCGDPCDCCNR